MDERDFERAEIVLYQSDGANVPVRVRYAAGTFWMTQSEIGGLFGVDRSVVSRHLSNIYESEELQVEGTCAKNARLQVGRSDDSAKEAGWDSTTRAAHGGHPFARVG